MNDISRQIDQFAALLSAARHILLFTGAGVSTRSGIPDFRGPNGVWKRRQPVYYQDFMTSESARIEHWDYKLEGWPAFRTATPNTIHQAATRLEGTGRLALLITQNIDGLHRRAGTSAEKLVELHGTNDFVECQSCHAQFDPEPHFESFRQTRHPPRCPCGGFLKPATISFGQSLRPGDLVKAEAGVRAADLVVALGSTLSVYPASGLPLAAAERGIPYVIVNQGATDHDHLPQVTLRIEGDAAEVFPVAVEQAAAKW